MYWSGLGLKPLRWIVYMGNPDPDMDVYYKKEKKKTPYSHPQNMETALWQQQAPSARVYALLPSKKLLVSDLRNTTKSPIVWLILRTPQLPIQSNILGMRRNKARLWRAYPAAHRTRIICCQHQRDRRGLHACSNSLLVQKGETTWY